MISFVQLSFLRWAVVLTLLMVGTQASPAFFVYLSGVGIAKSIFSLSDRHRSSVTFFPGESGSKTSCGRRE